MADATFIQSGASIDYTPGSAVLAGAVVVQVNLVGVACRPIAANELGSLAVEGIFSFVKTAGLQINVGDLVYWDTAPPEANKTSASNFLIGKCTKASATTDTRVEVKMDQ